MNKQVLRILEKGEESVRKKEEKFRTQTRTRRVESRTTTTYAFAVGAWAEAYPQQLPREWNGICFSGQRPSTGTCKVIQRLRREKRKKIEGEKASNKIS